jgi:hypothetical protein
MKRAYLDARFNSIFMDKQALYDKMPISNPGEVTDKIAALGMEIGTAESLIPMGYIASCGVLLQQRLNVLNQWIADLEHLWRTMNNPKKSRRY